MEGMDVLAGRKKKAKLITTKPVNGCFLSHTLNKSRHESNNFWVENVASLKRVMSYNSVTSKTGKGWKEGVDEYMT